MAKDRKEKKRKKKFTSRLFWLCIIALIVWTAWGNLSIQTTDITITNSNLPLSFDGFRIAHVSDLHNTEFGKDNQRLIEILKNAQPDIIAITGDIVDSNRTDVDTALNFARQAAEIAPCYFVAGNQETSISDSEYSRLKDGLTQIGVTILKDSKVTIERGEEKISIIGIEDFFLQNAGEFTLSIDADKLCELNSDEQFSILLSHRPDYFDDYVKSGCDLALTGHTHGGQFRLPYIGGLYVPSQGFFPEYDAGIFSQDGTDMIVSRGLGNSRFPFRFNNRPEVIIIELKTEK
jgi:predicted MPP superfamily phosphohydrolase